MPRPRGLGQTPRRAPPQQGAPRARPPPLPPPDLMQLRGSSRQSTLQRNRSQASQPMGGVSASPFSRATEGSARVKAKTSPLSTADPILPAAAGTQSTRLRLGPAHMIPPSSPDRPPRLPPGPAWH